MNKFTKYTGILALCCTGLFAACGRTPLPTPDGAGGGQIASVTVGVGGMGGQGGSMTCEPDQAGNCSAECVEGTCQECVDHGCDAEKAACYIGYVHYTDMLGCLDNSLVKATCGMECAGVGLGSPISAECAACAKPLTSCTFSCDQTPCDPQEVAEDCGYCLGTGCDASSGVCDLALENYHSVMTCLQKDEVQTACPDCFGVTDDDATTPECLSCASKLGCDIYINSCLAQVSP